VKRSKIDPMDSTILKVNVNVSKKYLEKYKLLLTKNQIKYMENINVT